MNQPPDNANSPAATSTAAAAARLPLAVVLESLAEDLGDRQVKAAVNELLPKLQAGKSLDEAVAECRQSIPAYLKGLLRSASSGDRLAETCDTLVRIRDASQHTWLSMRAMLAYPIALLVALIVMSFILVWFVLPPFASLFDEFELELPPVTEFYLSTAHWMPVTLIAALLLLVLVTLGPRMFGVGFAIRNAVPVLGRLYTTLSHEEFSTTLASFIRLNTPLHEALDYTADLLTDRGLAIATDRMAQQVERGISLADALQGSRSFDRSLGVIAGWGEAGSNLPQSLELAADMFAERRRQRLHLLKRIIPPLALVIVATMALSGVVMLLLPLIKLIEGLS